MIAYLLAGAMSILIGFGDKGHAAGAGQQPPPPGVTLAKVEQNEITEVKAPIAGRISRALVTTGNYVSGVSGVNTLLTTLVTTDPVYVYTDIDETTLLKLNRLNREGKILTQDGHIPVEVGLSDEEGFPAKGAVESFDNHVNPATGSLVLRAIVPNADGKFIPGLFARIRRKTTSRCVPPKPNWPQ